MTSPLRTDNPCTCGAGIISFASPPGRENTTWTRHHPDCLSLQPKQPAPGDEPDPLTHLVRVVRALCSATPECVAERFETRAMDLIADARAERARIVQNSRHGEIRKQAFLELAEELAEMEPAQRDAHIRRILNNQ